MSQLKPPNYVAIGHATLPEGSGRDTSSRWWLTTNIKPSSFYKYRATPRSFKSYATPIKCLDLDDNSGQLKLEGWLYVVFIAYTLFGN